MERLQIINSPYTELAVNRHIVEQFTQELVNSGMDITFAEGVTGGSLIDAITIPGSTRIIHIGGIFYSTESKIDLGVEENTIRNFGEYSPEISREMAIAMLGKSGAAVSIASVGHLDIKDTNSKRHISIAYAKRGQEPWIKTIYLPHYLQSRRLANMEIAQSVFSSGLHFLRNNRSLFLEDSQNYSFVDTELFHEELTAVDTSAGRLLRITQKLGVKIATIESCTAGAIANALTNVSGAGKTFDRGWLAYDENVKNRLGVPLITMVNGNVYSLKVAQEMGEAVLRNSKADIVIATTGTMETLDTRPYHRDTLPGTVYVAVIAKGFSPFLKKLVISCPLDKTREQVKIEAVREILSFAIEALEYVLSQPTRSIMLIDADTIYDRVK
ncbi:MAG: CinA family protein [Patescibacteria group bacterium]